MKDDGPGHLQVTSEEAERPEYIYFFHMGFIWANGDQRSLLLSPLLFLMAQGLSPCLLGTAVPRTLQGRWEGLADSLQVQDIQPRQLWPLLQHQLRPMGW